MALLSVGEAQRLVLENTQRLSAGLMQLSSMPLGLVLAEDIASDVDSPPFDKSMVDGYAVRSSDVVSQATMSVVDEILAGMVSTRTVRQGEAASIMTGAAIPQGADAVVMHEVTEYEPATRQVRIPGPVKARQNVMAQAAEMKQGELVLKAGTPLRPQEMGLLATLGRTSARIYRQPRIAVLSTGDEIVEPDKPLGPGQIRNSNASLLSALVTRAKGMSKYLGIARDHPDDLRQKTSEGLQADVLLITGGVSAGKVDLVPQVLAEAGVQAVFHKVAMKPGKPIFFGKQGTTLAFGLPGNPVSVLVGFELFVRPAIRKMLGGSEPFITVHQQARLMTDFQHKSDRPTYFPVSLKRAGHEWQAIPIDWKGSGDMRSICQSNGFAVFPSGEVRYSAGAMIEALMPELDSGS